MTACDLEWVWTIPPHSSTSWNPELVLPDFNVLVYAHREDVANHPAYRAWLEGVVNGDEAYGISELILSGFIRVVTHPKVFNKPSPFADALAFAEQLHDQPNSILVEPGPRHWEIFRGLCVAGRREGKSRARRLSRGAGDRIWLRVDHD